MNIGKLVILLITIALGALSASAQQGDGSVTFTDNSNQSITISRFGTVLNFKNSYGKETAPGKVYRVCPCSKKEPCIESDVIPSKETKSQFEVTFPKEGTTLKKGETLVVTATYHQAELTVRRRVNWEAGSSSVAVDEVIYASKPLCVCTFELEKASLKLTAKNCPRPPGSIDWWICPPEADKNPEGEKAMHFEIVHNFQK